MRRLSTALWTSLVVAVFSTVATGQQIKLSGRLVTDEGKPVPNTRVEVAGEQPAMSDANGRFSIHLSSKKEGERVVIIVEKNWIINQPLDGEWTLPALTQKDPQTLTVIIVPSGSKALWTDARIEKELTPKSNQANSLDPNEYIQELARKYGSTPDVTKKAFEKWATAQNGIANTLREQAAGVEGPEATRLWAETVAAYRRALLVLTRESRSEVWATTQHDLGYALQEQGVRTKGPDAVRLLREAVAAYREALTVRTREQLPLHWAITHNDLGTALLAQGIRAESSDALQLIHEAADAYRQALLVFTREFMPRQWGMTQHNLGSALHEQATRTEGPDGLQLSQQAVAAYRQALLVRTREQVPQAWAQTQNNLANALQAQVKMVAGPESMKLLGEALTAYQQALLVLNREQTPRLWAMTKHNIGSALQEQGSRSEGPEARRLFSDAVIAYREALLVWTREKLPQQWATAEYNLARAQFNLKEWTSAAESYENVLEIYPDFRAAYERARALEHEVLFNYQRALKLNEAWLQRNPNDFSAVADLAENHFTTGTFEECGRRISSALSDERFDAKLKIVLRAIEIANLIALNRSAEVPLKMKNLIEMVGSQQADFKVQRSFAGIQHFISESPQFAARKAWLSELFSAMGAENRDAITQKLRAASQSFTP
jgi:tetratricopeptide (TPR) repeat protein